jgi:hypothetical protein
VLQLDNTTPFQAGIALFPNEQGIDALSITLKATFEMGKGLALATEQRPLQLEDEYWGEPGRSSIKYASEIHLLKPSTDVVLVGEAWAPNQRPRTQVEVSLSVAECRKTILVFGDRSWSRGLTGFSITPPLPFEKMPLVYERAFGGGHETDPAEAENLYEARNPVGCGFAGKRAKRDIEGMKLPNLEDPAHLIEKPIDQPPPAGFGFIAPSWEPRRSYAGTYDEAWEKQRAPYLPKDFNSRFFNMAHPDLICKNHLKGGEPVEVINASPNGALRFKLPSCRIEAVVWITGREEKPQLHLETVLIEPNRATLCMTYRALMICGRKALRIERVGLALQALDVTGKAA